jgi:hypothetical protein
MTPPIKLFCEPVRLWVAAIVAGSKSLPILAGAVAIATVTLSPAMANLVLAGPDVVGGFGFGNLPRALTIQSHGLSQTTNRDQPAILDCTNGVFEKEASFPSGDPPPNSEVSIYHRLR